MQGIDASTNQYTLIDKPLLSWLTIISSTYLVCTLWDEANG